MHVAYGDFTLFVRPSQTVPLYIDFFSTPRVIPMRPYNPTCVVWALPISLAATFGISGGSLPFLISFPGLLRWFSSSSVAFLPYFIQVQNVGITSNGLPHSAIQGSQDMCSFPWLFAAYHGLLRLVAPRHPPYTYIRLTILSFLLYRRVLRFPSFLKHRYCQALPSRHTTALFRL